MNLLDSLLDAIVRLDGDALVMHVGEKPYVVTTSEATNQFRGPLAWGQVELSTRALTSDAVAGMLGQILPIDQRSALEEYGATEYEVSAANHPDERFTVVAARGGDDIWVEMRRQPTLSAEAVAVIAELRNAEAAQEEEIADEILADDEELLEVVDEVRPVASAQPAALVQPKAIDLDAELAAELVAVAAAEPIDEPVIILHDDSPAPAEELPVETMHPVAATTEVSTAVDVAPEPLPVVLNTDDMARDARHTALDDHDGSEAEEPVSFEIDSDRDLAEELLTIETDFEGGMLASGQDWTDDVMTEGELGELLRATAAAVIAGEMNPDASPSSELAAVPDAPPTPEAVADPASTLPNVAVIEPVPAETIAVVSHEPEPPASEPRVVRATEELPALVEYQIERDRVASSPLFAEDRALDEPQVPAASEAAADPAADRTEAPLVSEPFYVLLSNEEAAPAESDEPVRAFSRDDTGESAAVSLDDDADGEVERAPLRPAAVVLPLTRQPKVETAGESRVSVATTLQRLLRLAAARGAGTVYVVANTAPLVRVDGEFSTLEGEPTLSGAFVERLLSEVAPSTRGASPAAEWLIEVPEIGRVRCVTFRDHRGPGVIFRMVPARAISADQLGLSAELQALCSEADGLVLVTGGRGSGKSTLLTSFVDLINRTRSDHIITTESQIDFVHEPKRSFISQREVRGEDAMVSAVRAACREEPDVLIVEDLRTQELAALALDAAESGRLVFASVPGLSTPSALERLIELFPAERREKVQASLAGSLRGIISQVLLRKLRGGRVAAREVLFNTPAVAGLIMEGKTFQLPASLENGRGAGMMSFAESLASLVREGTVHPAHAYRKAPNREQFLAALRRSGVDTAIAERLG